MTAPCRQTTAGARTVAPFHWPEFGIARFAARCPGMHILFVGPAACARHSVTANLYLYPESISYLATSLSDIARGVPGSRVVEAACEVARRSRTRISTLLIYSGCEDELLCTDFAPIVAEIEERLGIRAFHFGRNKMTAGGTDLHGDDFFAIPFRTIGPARDRDRGVNFIGPPVPPRQTCDVAEAIVAAGFGPIRAIGTTRTEAELQAMASSRLNVVLSPPYAKAAAEMEDRLGIPFATCYRAYDRDGIEALYETVSDGLGVRIDPSTGRKRFERALERARRSCDPFVLDGMGMEDPIEAARAIMRCGVPVVGVTARLGNDLESGLPCPVVEAGGLSCRQAQYRMDDTGYVGNLPFESELIGYSAPEHIVATAASSHAKGRA